MSPIFLRRQASQAALHAALGGLLAVCCGSAPAQESSILDLSLLTIRHAPETPHARRAPYSFSASLMLSQGSALRQDSMRDANTIGRVSSGDSVARLVRTDAAGRPWFDDAQPALGARFRLESNGQRFEIRPRRHSIWFQYSMEFK